MKRLFTHNPHPSNLGYTPLTSSTEGRIMRRREAGRGAAPAGQLASRHSGGIGAPPGTTMSPCQELAEGSAGAFARQAGLKRGLAPE